MLQFICFVLLCSCLDRTARLFYHSSDLRNADAATPNAEVSFVVVQDERSGKDVAVAIDLLPAGTLELEHALPDRVQGLVVSAASASADEGQLMAVDENGVESQYSYGMHQVTCQCVCVTTSAPSNGPVKLNICCCMPGGWE